jgi:hypothetical protein
VEENIPIKMAAALDELHKEELFPTPCLKSCQVGLDKRVNWNLTIPIHNSTFDPKTQLKHWWNWILKTSPQHHYKQKHKNRSGANQKCKKLRIDEAIEFKLFFGQSSSTSKMLLPKLNLVSLCRCVQDLQCLSSVWCCHTVVLIVTTSMNMYSPFGYLKLLLNG